MLRIIHNATEAEAPKAKALTRKEKAMAWMHKQIAIDRMEAVAKYREEIKEMKQRHPEFQPFQTKKARY